MSASGSCAFGNARALDNSLPNTSCPSLTFKFNPGLSWNTMSARDECDVEATSKGRKEGFSKSKGNSTRAWWVVVFCSYDVESIHQHIVPALQEPAVQGHTV